MIDQIEIIQETILFHFLKILYICIRLPIIEQYLFLDQFFKFGMHIEISSSLILVVSTRNIH